jgi:hypothetical protein
LADPAEFQRRLEQQGSAPNYTQVNILFPATNVELPSADTYNAFPPEAQKALLEAFKFEQMQRHTYLRNQQQNDHELNQQTAGNYFKLRVAGLFCASILTLAILAAGIFLVKIGASLLGFAMLVTAIAGLIGTAVWGHRSKTIANAPEEPDEAASEE